MPLKDRRNACFASLTVQLPHCRFFSSQAKQTRELRKPFPVTTLQDTERDIDLEFQAIRQLTERPRRARQKSSFGSCRSKDRYRDIAPFENHRVPLPDSRYINASFVPQAFSGRKFIAAQGPMTSTIGDFWHMVAYHRVHEIVGLCKMGHDEAGECADYMPQQDKPIVLLDGALRVRAKSREATLSSANTMCQIVEVFFNGDVWDVIQIHHAEWDDHESAKSSDILHLAQRVACGLISDLTLHPVLVHCSAGVGRTGCFIGLCNLIACISDQLKSCKDQVPFVSIMDSVLHLRMHRPFMVQTVEQYRFLYRGLEELLSQQGLLPLASPYIAKAVQDSRLR
eukprot:gnl/TRDRNA2_/TRDRNA2_202257_c0_seq1.p1 gnl/TRDRNA2_/TRDRNA2_202257_c0~~gnl/TRDRNA2_/TRDRNA2_202257_c0_seq1.p1  ORF type:complete len:340 (-),score=42.56 gnl/TRDRNA2_/TRDRNA2_202257_c0_seq1:118-1137(-)